LAPDDLNAPLGQNKDKKRWKLPAATPQVVAGVLGLCALVAAGWAVFGNDPLGGEPLAIVATAKTATQPIKSAAAGGGKEQVRYDGSADSKPHDGAVTVKAITPPPGSKTVTIIDGSSGKTQNIFIPDDGAEKTAKGPAGRN
jgi:hypothetical protein